MVRSAVVLLTRYWVALEGAIKAYPPAATNFSGATSMCWLYSEQFKLLLGSTTTNWLNHFGLTGYCGVKRVPLFFAVRCLLFV